jgi:Tfp pilus assembly protein PilN
MIQWMASPKSNGRANGNGVWAAVHQQEGNWRVVIARRRERWEVLESLTLRDFELTSLAVMFEQHGVSHVVRVARGRETVARCLPVPGGDEAGLVAAVSLLAEAELPSALPSYRRAAGVLPNGDGAEMRTALLTGWMNGGASPKALTEVDEAWTTPAAALALLRGESGRAAVYTEPSEGLMCLLVPGPERTIARVLVDEPSSEAAWAQTLSAAVSEAAQMAGASASMAQSLNSGRRAGGRLFLETASLVSLKSRVSGLREDQGWLDDYGVAIGALLVAGSDLATVRALAGLHATAPAEDRTAVEAASVWLARPANAWGLVAAACAIMLLAPLGLAAARKAILEKRAEKVKGLSVGGEGIEKKAAMYEQFATSRWPMTKLMADVAQATPMGVVVTNLQITNGQGLTMQGTAENPEQVNKLESNLNAARVFGSVSVGRVDTKSDSVTEFDLSARVVQPSAQVKTTEEQDWKTKTLAVRLYGEGASNTAPPSSESREGDRGDRGNRRRDRGDRADRNNDNSGNGSSNAERDRKPSSSLASEPVPPPLTDADIQKMDFTTATREFGRRKPYPLVHKELDAATKQRLNDEVAKLRDQMDKTRSKADSSGTPAAPAAPAPGAAPAAPPSDKPASGTPAPAPAPPASGGKS